MVFKNTASKAIEYVNTARTVAAGAFGAFAGLSLNKASGSSSHSPPPAPSPQRGTWAQAAFAVGGALLAGAAAGTAYYKGDDLTYGYTWIADHLKYVGKLLDEDALRGRVDKLVVAEKELGVLFRACVVSSNFSETQPYAHLM